MPDLLHIAGIPCQAYHAGRPAKERSRVLEDWNEGRVPVVAATIAFGMGIDRASEFILHRLLMQRFCDKAAGGGVEALISLLPSHSLAGEHEMSNQLRGLPASDRSEFKYIKAVENF